MNEKRYAALTKVAWGFVFTYLDFRLGSINVLPNFIGFWMIYSAIVQLAEECRDLTLLKPFALILTLWSAIDWCLSLIGISADQMLPLVGTIVGLVSLYFHFQLLTDLAQFAPDDAEGSALRSRLLVIRNILIIANTVSILGIQVMKVWEDMQFVLLWVYLAVIIAILALMINLFYLRSRLRPEEQQIEK